MVINHHKEISDSILELYICDILVFGIWYFFESLVLTIIMVQRHVLGPKRHNMYALGSLSRYLRIWEPNQIQIIGTFRPTYCYQTLATHWQL